MVIDPAFDPKTKTWFVSEPCDCEAPTIRLLKRALRKLHPNLRFEVLDYYVGNSPRTVWANGPKPLSDIRYVPPRLPNFSKGPRPKRTVKEDAA